MLDAGEEAPEADIRAGCQAEGPAEGVYEQAPPGCQIRKGALLDVGPLWRYSYHSDKYMGAGRSCAG